MITRRKAAENRFKTGVGCAIICAFAVFGIEDLFGVKMNREALGIITMFVAAFGAALGE